jgi:hypothetical protein
MTVDSDSSVTLNNANEAGGIFCSGARTDFPLNVVIGNKATTVFPNTECVGCLASTGGDSCGATPAPPTAPTPSVTPHRPTTPKPTSHQSSSTGVGLSTKAAIAIAIIIPVIVIVGLCAIVIVYVQYRRRHPYSRIV